MDPLDGAPPTKRFKHQSYAASLKEVHLPSALSQTHLNEELYDNQSYFHEALEHWRQLNLSPAFIKFANQVHGLSASITLLLHHWREIVGFWDGAMKAADDEAMKALLDLLQKLAHDLRTTLSPAYSDLLGCLLALLPRSLSAPTLTTLLATFSALFKYLLIPSVDPALAQQTWTGLRAALPKCNPEVQRAVAELWGSVLRRLKSGPREKVIMLMVEDQEGIEDASAWAFVYACKSVSQTMHTSTPLILTPLVDFHLAHDNVEAAHTLIRRVLTALIHHCKSAEQFSAVGDLLVDRLSSRIGESTHSGHEDPLNRVLGIVAVACSVRHGSRLTQNHVSAILAIIPAVNYTHINHTYILRLSTSALLAADLPLWTTHGRKILEYAQHHPALHISLLGSLAELNWGGWKPLGHPAVLRRTPELLDAEPRATLRLLVDLQKGGKLGEVDHVWRIRMGKWVEGRLSSWERTEEKVLELCDIIALAPVLPSQAAAFVQIVEITLDTPNPKEDYEASRANATLVLASCMQGLAKEPSQEWAYHVDLTSWTRKMVEIWGWNETVLSGLVNVIAAQAASIKPMPFDELYPYLRDSLLSHSRTLRLHALQLLASKAVQSWVGNDVVKRCLQGEEGSLDVQGARERVLRIGRLGQVIRDGDERAADLAVRWLIAQLKVNLRPLWSPAAEALAQLADRFGDVVWKLMFGELQAVTENAVDAAAPAWMRKVKDDEPADGIFEDERTWRDPSAHKLLVAVGRWAREGGSEREIIQAGMDRFDGVMYETQLLAAFGVSHSLAEKHNRELVPFFLALVDAKLPRQKLTSWLIMFSKFTNPKALHSTGRLQALFVSLLSHADRSMQTIALSCVLTYRSSHLVPHEGTLRALLDETRWRDELANLDIAGIDLQDRSEFVDVIVRLLFGIMLERRGRGRGADRRAAILTALGGCSDEELGLLVELMLRPLQGDIYEEPDASGSAFKMSAVPVGVTEKQEVGFLNLLADVLRNLGPRLLKFWPALISTTLNLTAQAQHLLEAARKDENDEDELVEDEEEDGGELSSSTNATRTVRQLGVKRFTDFFRSAASFDFAPYIVPAFQSIISPRLAALDRENIQAPSALLELFHVWSSRAEYTGFLVIHDQRVLPKVYDCLIATNVKPSVIGRVFDLVEKLLDHSEADQLVADAIVKPQVGRLLSNMATFIQRSKEMSSGTHPLFHRQISILSRIAQYLDDGTQAAMLLTLLSPLLRKSHKVVNEKVKADILKILQNLLPLVPDLKDSTSTLYNKTYDLLSHLFQILRARQCRVGLLASFRQLAVMDPKIAPLAELVEGLNAYSSRRIEEPDFDRRLRTFAELNETLYPSLSAKDWLPLLHNMLHFIQDANELAIRTNASSGLRRFTDAVANNPGSDFERTFVRTLYPALKNGLRTKSELVRSEVLAVIAYSIRTCEGVISLQEMRVLLADGDEEANFFNNVLHVQVHRRARALRRLADYSEKGHFHSATLAEVFVPLVGNFITMTESLDHHLINEAITTTGRLSKQLSWGAYHALVQQYLRLSKDKDKHKSERVYVRTLVAVLDGFHFPMDELVDEAELDENEGEEAVPSAMKPSTLAKIADAVNTRLLPALLHHLENRNEAEDGARIPIAVGIIKVALHLPEATRDLQITRLITTLSQVFRSKSQETRDLARETLCRIAIMLGSPYLSVITRELRGALTRGPQLHVLAFTAHTLLAHITSNDHSAAFPTLDNCVSDVVHVSAEVVFGESGKDVQSEDFKTKMREVRTASGKGLDSFTILARHITPTRISSLLLPIRAIMQETISHKVLQIVDDVLRRIASGLNTNKLVSPTDLLALCNTLISQNARFLQEMPRKTKQRGGKKDNVTVQLKRKAASESDHYTNNAFRFVAFGLDLFNTAFRRGKFDFQDAGVVARLEPIVAVIGNTLYSDNGQVIIQGLKASAAIVKCPLKAVDKSAPVFIRQILDVVKQSGSTESEVSQVALKSLAAIIRDCHTVQVKERDLIQILDMIGPDLEEPDRQTSVFMMLRAIVSRKFVVPEIYDMMDKVSEIMVTNQSQQVQELCRGVLLQFLLDYPQGKGRLRNQMTFLAKNLSYVHESGRKSVMELLNALVSKFEVTLVQEYSDLIFVALVMVLVNDDSAKCKEMTASLIKALFVRLDAGQRATMVSHLHSWCAQSSQARLATVASQVYGLLVDALREEAKPYVAASLRDLNDLLRQNVHDPADDDENGMTVDVDWQAAYHCLVTQGKIITNFPDIPRQADGVDWSVTVDYLLYPHAWVRLAACRLLGQLFAAFSAAAPGSITALGHYPLSLEGMESTAKDLCSQLRSENLDASLSLQVVKNLFYIGKCFAELPWSPQGDGEDEEDVEDGASDNEERVRVEGRRGGHPLPWLFSKLSYQARSAHIRRRNRALSDPNWVHQPTSVMRWFAAMVGHLPAEAVERFLVHILSPVYRIIEDDTIRDDQIQELKTTGIELQELVQAKVGTTKFASVYNQIRQGITGVRRDRKVARAIQVTAHPEAAAKRKMDRNQNKKVTRKRRDAAFAESKHRGKSGKRKYDA